MDDNHFKRLKNENGDNNGSFVSDPTLRQSVQQNRGFDEILDDLHKLEEELSMEADHVISSMESRAHNSIPSPTPPPPPPLRATPTPLMTSRDVLDVLVVDELKSLLLSPGVEHGTDVSSVNGDMSSVPEMAVRGKMAGAGSVMVMMMMANGKMAAGDSSLCGSCEDFMDSSNSCSSPAPSCRSSCSIQPFHEVMKIYVEGGRSLNVSIATGTKSRDVLKQLSFDVQRFSLVEVTPALYLECFLEDDEILLQVIESWSFDSENCFMVAENNNKYDMFSNPHKYFSKISNEVSHPSEQKKREYLQEYVRNQFVAPDCDGMLFMKMDGKKSWRKYYFALRPSGLYYCPKGRGKSLMDLVCLQQLYNVRIYSGVKWKKKFKSPTEFGFALKHPKVQKQVSRFIKYFCAEDEDTKQLWINYLRLAKFGNQTYDNFQRLGVKVEESESFDKQEVKMDSNHKINFHKLEQDNFCDFKKPEIDCEMLSSFSVGSSHHSINEHLENNSNGSSPKLLRTGIHVKRMSKESQQIHGNKHETIKRALSSGTRILRQDSNALNFSRSCPQSPKIDSLLLQTSSEHDLLSNQLKLHDEPTSQHLENLKMARNEVSDPEGRKGGRFAILAGSFKERLLSNNRREVTSHLKICDRRLGGCRKSEDFDCLPPPPAELLSEFLNISRKQSDQV